MPGVGRESRRADSTKGRSTRRRLYWRPMVMTTTPARAPYPSPLGQQWRKAWQLAHSRRQQVEAGDCPADPQRTDRGLRKERFGKVNSLSDSVEKPRGALALAECCG